MIDSELPTDLRRPCTPSRGPASPTPRNLRFRGDPGVCGSRSPIDEWDRSGPRRRPTIWGTWPPNLSPPIGINHLGFLEPATPDDPHNHRVKARSLGALIAIAGARAVVVTGRVVAAEDVLTYTQHLPVGADLTLVRLSADRDTLREHLRRRAQGGGWRETGDPLPGCGPPALERWLQEAAAENERLECNRLGDAEVGVDGREPEAIASDVFAATPRLLELVGLAQ